MTKRSRDLDRRALLSGLAALLVSLGSAWADGPIPPFKDDLFAYPGLTATSQDGTYLDVDYSEARDIDRRDEIAERRVKPAYVDLAPLSSQREIRVDTSAGPVKAMETGEPDGTGPVVLFIHGRNGDRRLGMNDRTFGGNFNRLKNLMRLSGGLYVTADAGTFAPADAARVAALVEDLGRRRAAPSVVLACASMGGQFCWELLQEKAVAERVSAVAMLSANNPPNGADAMTAAAGGRRIPVLLGHGTRDKVFGWDAAKGVYDRLHAAGYPVRFVSFDGGNHGTPIRMIDWRDSLNWLLAHRG